MKLRQLEMAALQGFWRCHGYRLEPDSECPKCKGGVF